MTQFKTILALDFYRPAVETYKANFPDVDVRYQNIRTFTDWPEADVIIGGPPCQPYSQAGLQRGADDPRDCVPDFINAVRTVKPRQFLMENVKGFYKSPYRDQVADELEAAGYDVEFRLMNAADYGVPQRRERCFIWGIRDDIAVSGMRAWPVPTTKGNPVTIRQTIRLEPVAEYVNKYATNGRPNPFTEPMNPDKPSPTVAAQRHGKNSDWVKVNEAENLCYHLTIDDLLRLQGVPRGFTWAANQSINSKYHIIGNGWASPMGSLFAEAFKKADPASYTVIDLFCGGGLGAAGWHAWTGASGISVAA